MGDVTNEVIFETLKSMQGPLARVDQAQQDLHKQLRGLMAQMHAKAAELASLYGRLGRLEDRVQRIERRLGLNDVTLS